MFRFPRLFARLKFSNSDELFCCWKFPVVYSIINGRVITADHRVKNAGQSYATALAMLSYVTEMALDWPEKNA